MIQDKNGMHPRNGTSFEEISAATLEAVGGSGDDSGLPLPVTARRPSPASSFRPQPLQRAATLAGHLGSIYNHEDPWVRHVARAGTLIMAGAALAANLATVSIAMHPAGYTKK